MLKEKDKIFTNLYGYGKWNLEGAKSRGIWSDTDKLIAKGSDYIIEEIKKRTPIWKKEHYTDKESVWLKGNPIKTS